jgi:phosphoribosylformylglycinamidine cyclo-ligase
MQNKWSENKMTTYKDAGVDVEKKNVLLRRLKEHVKLTFDNRVMASETLFKSMLVNVSELKKYKEPMLAFNADGVGTKTAIAEVMDSWEGIGFDVVNHCINDILTMGAKPLFFSDYIASDKLNPEIVEIIVRSVTDCCKENGIIFVGGETAEMPSIYNQGTSDVAGFMTGVVDRQNVIDGKRISEDDVLIGLPSTGLHTNGFSLARKAVADGHLDLKKTFPELGMKLGEALLMPHRNYLKTTMQLLGDRKIKGIAHITGGSFRKNLPRIIPKGLGAEINKRSWEPMPIFRLIQHAGKVPDEEMYLTFNMGIGFVYVVAKKDSGTVIEMLKDLRENPALIGRIINGGGVIYVD